MIDEYWTWAFYGYHSDELKPQSGKPVVARCDDCCQYRIVRMDAYCDLCRPCATSINFSMGHKSGNKSGGWRGGKACVECNECGKSISRHPSIVSDRNFCDKTCFAKFKNGKGVGMYIHTENTKAIMSVARNVFIADPVNREKLSAAKQGISYDEWEGFATDNPYCPLFDETCRESNREKYGRKCFLYGLDESENITSTGKHKKLSVHHVDMNKYQGCDNHEWNLVPLCLHHHGSAHTNLVMNRIIYLLNNVWNMVI